MLLYFFRVLNNKQKMYGGICTPPRTPRNSYISIYFGPKAFISPNLMIIIMGTFKTPQTLWNNPISHRFISSLSDVIPFMKALSHNYADDTWTSNACHGHNFYCGDMKFSEIVPDTITILNTIKKKR